MSVEVRSFGCRLNLAEGEALRAALGEAGELVVVNSCAVTAAAAAEAAKAIRRAARARPGVRIVVTGCASEVERARFADMAEVAAIVPNAFKLQPDRYGVAPQPQGVSPQEQASVPRHARLFLPVQNGCDHRCTFCIIPFGRGPSRSEPVAMVVARIAHAVAAGTQEVVLTGVDITAYGSDLPARPSLAQLIAAILHGVPALARLRLSSLDPCEIDAPLEALIAGEPRLMPHLHLSLQAGDDLILKRMKRRHLRADAIALVARLKAARPALAIGADLIAGFPTESEAMFARSLALLEECDVVLAHVFPFSPREGTPAARMPQLEREVIRARAARLRDAAEARRQAWLQRQVGTVANVLIERDGRTGHAENFAKVRLASSSPPAGEGTRANTILALRITGVDGDTLLGMPA